MLLPHATAMVEEGHLGGSYTFRVLQRLDAPGQLTLVTRLC